MNRTIKNLFYDIKLLLKKGIIDIIGAGIINKLLVLFTTIVLIRVLSKNEYGIFTYAYNLINLVMIFSSLGMNGAILQFAAEQKNIEERIPIYKFTFSVGMLSNICFAIGVIIYSLTAPENIAGSNRALRMFSFILVFQYIYISIVSYYRVELNNKRYRSVTNLNSVMYFCGAGLGAYCMGITGTILGRYLGFLIAVVYGVYCARNSISKILSYNIKKIKKGIEIIKYGIVITLTNAISQILYSLDVLLIGIVIGTSTSVADYKTATTIPFALAFIPQMIITFIYPYFARNKDDKPWILKHTKKILIYLLPLNIVISFFGVIFAPWIISLAFGREYLDCLTCFRILMISYFFSGTFRVLLGNILVMLRKVKINLYFGIIESVVNIILDVVLIKLWGSTGAAIATTSIIILSSILSGAYLFWHLSKRDA